jgi:hypothetical protein
MPGTNVVQMSARYLAALPSSHTIATAAEVWGTNGLLQPLQIEASSSITVDRASLARRTCSVTLTDPYAGTVNALVPQTAADLLTPYGNELVLYRGIDYDPDSPGTDTELIQLGVFGMSEVDIDDSGGDLVITLLGSDRSLACQHAGFTDVYPIPANSNVGTTIGTLINSLQTGLLITQNFAATTALTPATPVIFKPGDDPWAKCCELAAAAGCELYFDRAGICCFQPIPDPTQAPINWSYDWNSVNIANNLKRVISRATAPNYIIRDGQGSGIAQPLRGVAEDDDPTSPTWIGGPYGYQVDYKTSNLYTNPQLVASADLLIALGSIESIQIQAIPKVDHEPDDVVEITRARAGLTSELYVIDSFQLGFGTAGVLDFTARQVIG